MTVTDVVLTASGREEPRTNTIRTDGREHSSEHGYAIIARWRTGRVLEAGVKRHGRQVSRLTYAVSADRMTLTIDATARAHDGYPAVEQFSVFDRVSRPAVFEEREPSV